jgi:hypothetical protein
MNASYLKIVVLAVLSCWGYITYAQTVEIQGGKIHDFYPESAGFTDCNIYMKNAGTGSLRIAYEKVSVDYPAGWDVSFCDNRNCFFNFRDKDTFSAMAPGEKASIKITVFPKGSADTAIIKYAVWDIQNPAVKDTLQFNIFVRWSLGNSISCFPTPVVYPVPAAQYINVNTQGASCVKIFSSAGQLLKIIDTFSAFTKIDVADLPQGNYIMTLTGMNTARNVTFTKN